MKHLFVPYELALLAKEKEFYEPCLATYNFHKELGQTSVEQFFVGFNENVSNSSLLASTAAPTYQQLMDWFLEKHGIYVIFDIEEECWMVYRKEKDKYVHESAGHSNKTEALTEAFKLT